MEQRTTSQVPSRGRKSFRVNDLSSQVDSERWRHKTGRPMADQFDPYYTWLGIPPSEQPADYYRLLGIKQFEDNREVISNAADQRMAHVRSFQTGPSARDSQRVLNDLSKAAGCLLNPRRKAMYDQHLQSSSVKTATEEALFPPQGIVKVQSASARSTKPPLRRQDSRRLRKPAVMVAGLLLVAIVGGVSAWAWLNRNTNVKPDALLGTSGSDLSKAIERTAGAAENKAVAKETQTAAPESPAVTDVSPTTAVATAANPATSLPKPTTNTAAATNASAVKRITPTDDGPPQPEIPKGKPKGLHFRGNDRVELADSRGLIDLQKPFTFEVWLRFEPEKNTHWIAGDLIIGPNHADVPAGGIAGWQLFVPQTQAGRHRIAFSTREGYASDFPVVANGWHHLAASGDTRRVTVHVNGRRSASGEISTLQSSFVASPIPIHIGGHEFLHANQPPGFTGDLRALRISSICRYTANFQPSPVLVSDADTQVLLDFPGSTGNTITDASGHGHHGTIHGAQWLEISDPTLMAVGTTPPKASEKGPASVAAPAPSPPPTVETIQPMPDEVALVKAREQVRKVLEADFKRAKEAKDQLALADRLMALAAESHEDLPGRFAMFEEAFKMAAQAGDLTKALSIIDDFSRRFEIDAAHLKAMAVAKAAEAMKTNADRRQMAETALGLLDELLMAGKLDEAADVAQTAVAAAARAKEVELGKAVRDYRDEIAQAKKHLNEAREAAAKLKDSPADAELNLRWGRFVCFYQRNWPLGLPFLAKGSDERLAAAAKLDLTNATKPEEQATIGQRWAEAVKGVEPAERTGVALRALHWLHQAESQLKGLAKADVEKQVKDLESGLPARFRLAANKANKPLGPNFQPPPEFVGLPGRVQVNGSDVGIMWKYESGLRLANTNVLGVLAQSNIPRGKLRMEFVGLVYVTESMTVNVSHNGGSPTATATLFIDNKPVGEVGGTRAASDVYKVDLNAGEHSIRWVLFGDDLGTCSLVCTNSATAQALALYHNQSLLNLVRNTPTRARLNVNMNRN